MDLNLTVKAGKRRAEQSDFNFLTEEQFYFVSTWKDIVIEVIKEFKPVNSAHVI